MASHPKRLPHAPLSYSEMTARQSAVTSEYDYGGSSSQYSLARSVTPNSRITFRRVDYASSQLYNHQNNNNNLSNSHSSSSNSHSHSFGQGTDVANHADTTAPRNVDLVRHGDTRTSHLQDTSAILQTHLTFHSHSEDHQTQETSPTMSEVGQPGRMAYAAVAKAAAAPPSSTSTDVSSTVAMPSQQAPQHRPVISSEDSGAEAATTRAQAELAAELESPHNPDHAWLTPPSPCLPRDLASAIREEGERIRLDILAAHPPINGLLVALDEALREKGESVQRRPEKNSDNGSDNAFRRTINVHNMNDWPMPGDSSKAKENSRPSAVATPPARANSDRLELLRAAVETAAREGIARHNLQKSPEKARSKSAPKTEDKEESGGSIDHKNTTDVESESRPSVNRQSQPFLHDHALCQNWTSTPMPPFEAHLNAKFWSNGLVSTIELARRVPRDYSPAHLNSHPRGRPLSAVGLGLRPSSANLRGGDLRLEQMHGNWQCNPPSTSLTSSQNYPSSISSLDCRQDTQQASWSNSHSWVADGERERAHWVKIQSSMYHAGLSKSPFVPSNFSEYVDQRVDETISKLEDAKEKLRLKQTEYDSLRSNLLAGGEVPLDEALFENSDNEEAVDDVPRTFSIGKNIWSARSGSIDEVQWPTVAQLKVYGEQPARLGLARGLPPTMSPTDY